MLQKINTYTQFLATELSITKKQLETSESLVKEVEMKLASAVDRANVDTSNNDFLRDSLMSTEDVVFGSMFLFFPP
jgi:hypothetical protein